MPTNLTATSAFSSPLSVPVGGDLRTAASVEAPFQVTMNRTQYLRDHSIGADSRAVNIPLAACTQDAAGGAGVWTFDATGGTPIWVQTNVTTSKRLVFDLSLILPAGVTVTNVKTRCGSLSAHAADVTGQRIKTF